MPCSFKSEITYTGWVTVLSSIFKGILYKPLTLRFCPPAVWNFDSNLTGCFIGLISGGSRRKVFSLMQVIELPVSYNIGIFRLPRLPCRNGLICVGLIRAIAYEKIEQIKLANET